MVEIEVKNYGLNASLGTEVKVNSNLNIHGGVEVSREIEKIEVEGWDTK